MTLQIKYLHIFRRGNGFAVLLLRNHDLHFVWCNVELFCTVLHSVGLFISLYTILINTHLIMYIINLKSTHNLWWLIKINLPTQQQQQTQRGTEQQHNSFYWEHAITQSSTEMYLFNIKYVKCHIFILSILLLHCNNLL